MTVVLGLLSQRKIAGRHAGFERTRLVDQREPGLDHVTESVLVGLHETEQPPLRILAPQGKPKFVGLVFIVTGKIQRRFQFRHVGGRVSRVLVGIDRFAAFGLAPIAAQGLVDERHAPVLVRLVVARVILVIGLHAGQRQCNALFALEPLFEGQGLRRAHPDPCREQVDVESDAEPVAEQVGFDVNVVEQHVHLVGIVRFDDPLQRDFAARGVQVKAAVFTEHETGRDLGADVDRDIEQFAERAQRQQDDVLELVGGNDVVERILLDPDFEDTQILVAGSPVTRVGVVGGLRAGAKRER